MITIAICEQNLENVAKIKELLMRCSMQRDVDFQTLWFSTESSMQNLGKYAIDVHIALVSLETQNGLQKGMRIYSLNPDCRILYYSSNPCELQPLFHSRPIEFHLWEKNDEVMVKKIDAIVSELIQSNAIFHYQTRKKLLLIPERNILCFQSDLKNIQMCMADGGTESLYAKLSDIEPMLSYRFVRTHQSFIVNTSYIRYVERDKHIVILEDGKEVPISASRYQKTIWNIESVLKKMPF